MAVKLRVANSRISFTRDLAVDVELPAGELGGEAHVLAAPADGQRELVVGDDDLHGAGSGRRGAPARPRRGPARCRRSGPGPRARGRCRSSRRAAPGPPPGRGCPSCRRRRRPGRRRESREETAILARPPGSRAAASMTTTPSAISGTSISKSLRSSSTEARERMICGPLRLAQHVEDVGLDAVAGAVALAGHLLADRQHRLGAAQVDDDVAALEAADDAGDELALAVLVLVEDVLALGVAGALDDDLLGGLGGDAAEAAAEGLELEEVAPLLVLGAGRGLVVRAGRRWGSRARRRAPPRCPSRARRTPGSC